VLGLDSDGLSYGPGTTGRTLVLLEDAVADAPGVLLETAGISATRSGQLAEEPVGIEGLDAEGVVFDELSVAVVDATPDQVQALGEAVVADNPILAVEAERIVYALESPSPFWGPAAGGGVSGEYLRGFREAAIAVSAASSPARLGEGATVPTAAVPAVDESRATWGVQAVGALTTSFTGNGVNVAILDTGFELQHPDFAGRNPVTRSFVPGEQVQDGHGHGTHCIGTACGPRVPGQLPRYGLACEAQIHAGKVLSNRGSGTDQGILAGIEWAINSGCQVISMSLGAPAQPGQPFSRVFDAVGQRALARGTLIVAAAGNESRRDQGILKPVGHPANCPSILAVGAIDSQGAVAFFSCTSDPKGGQVDIAGPGVAVYSSWLMPKRYNTISGTSMATPHVAGVAALISQARGATDLNLWGALMQTARRLPLSSMDVGCGLVQAP
jgi:subtilisin family serine protease